MRLLPAAAAFLFLAGLLVPAVPGAAQAPAASLTDAETRYEAALGAYLERRRELEALFQAHEVLVDRLDDVRRSGDGEGIRASMAQVYAHGVRVSAAERVVDAAAVVLTDHARVLLAAIDEREERLLDQLEAAEDEATRRPLRDELERIRRRHREVQAQVGEDLVPPSLLLPQISIRATDGPREILAKADLYERRAEELDSLLAAVERDLAASERRLQQQRGQVDFLRDLDRFGDDQIRGGTLTGTGADQAAGAAGPDDSLRLEDLPLPERVAWLTDYRDRVQMARTAAVHEAERFRDLAGVPR